MLKKSKGEGLKHKYRTYVQDTVGRNFGSIPCNVVFKFAFLVIDF